MIRPVRVVASAGAVVAATATVAIAAHPKVDPAGVPVGFFTAHSQMNSVPASALKKIVADGDGRVDGFLQHRRLAAAEATGFVTHPGPVFVMVAKGTVTNQEAVGGDCRSKTYRIDQGFVTRGIRTPHRLIAGSEGAELYLFYLAPRKTGPTDRPVADPC